MNSTSLTKVIWYDVSKHEYQSGSLNDLENLMSCSTNSHEIQPLERFNDTSEKTINKIVGELNKCNPSLKIIP